MDRCENYNAQSARGLSIAQIVFVVLSLILGIVQGSITAGLFTIAPIIYCVFQIAPITCTMISSQNKGKCIITASMILNILTAIFGSFSYICYSIAWTAISATYWNYYNEVFFPGDSATIEFYGWTDNVKAFTIISIIMILLALAMFVVNIWSAVLGYVSCQAQPQPRQYLGTQGGQVTVIQSSAYGQQGHIPQGYVNHGVNPGFPQQGIPPQNYPQQGIPPPNYPQQGIAQQGILAPGNLPLGVVQQSNPQQAIPEQGLPQAAQKP